MTSSTVPNPTCQTASACWQDKNEIAKAELFQEATYSVRLMRVLYIMHDLTGCGKPKMAVLQLENNWDNYSETLIFNSSLTVHTDSRTIDAVNDVLLEIIAVEFHITLILLRFALM